MNLPPGSQLPQEVTHAQWQSPIGGRGGGVELYSATLTADMSGSATTADIYDTSSALVEEDATIYNTLLDFSHLQNGDQCLVLKSGENYWIIHPEGSGPTFITFELEEGFYYIDDTPPVVNETVDANVLWSSNSSVVTSGTTVTVITKQAVRAKPGAKGLAVLTSGQWVILDLQKPAAKIRGTCVTLFDPSDDPETATYEIQDPVSLSQWPHNHIAPYDYISTSPPRIEAKNPYQFYGIDDETEVELTYNDSRNEWYISRIIPSMAGRVYFKFLTDWPDGLSQSGEVGTEVEVLHPAPGYEGALPADGDTFRDRFNKAHNAKGPVSTEPADTGIAEYDRVNAEWVIIECTHRATEIIGEVDSFVFSATTFPVTYVSSGLLNGSDPAPGTGSITVQNLFTWYSIGANRTILIKRNPVDGEWYPVMMGTTN